MKKVVAILLACIMLFSCTPVMTFAADTDVTTPGTLEANMTVSNGDKLTVSATWTIAATLTVEDGATLVIEENGYLTIAGTGRLVNNGNIVVKKNGAILSNGKGTGEGGSSFYNGETGTVTLNSGSYFSIERQTFAHNKGTINNIDRMTINGTLLHYVQYPQNFFVTYKNTEMWNRTETTVDFTISHVNDADLADALDYTKAENYVGVPAGGWCEHGVKEYILITPEDGDGDWVDTGRMKLVVNGTIFDTDERIDNDRGVFTITPVGSMNISILSDRYKDIVKLYDITLPRTEGYYVQGKDGEIDNVTVEYGKSFSFSVVLNPDYDKSEPYVYVNGAALEPDDYNYFDITGPIVDYTMLQTGGVQEDISITVMGVSSNASQEQMSGIVNFVKQIFDTIMSIFNYFGDLFEGLFGGLGTTTTPEETTPAA